MLFLIVVELLSVYIKNCPDIKSLWIDNMLYTITQLTDDTTIFLEDDHSVANILHVMDRFYMCSGLRLHKQSQRFSCWVAADNVTILQTKYVVWNVLLNHSPSTKFSGQYFNPVWSHFTKEVLYTHCCQSAILNRILTKL